jgi:class III poly(R)-hydroxyalkanoic acid synthase PhaE subunit
MAEAANAPFWDQDWMDANRRYWEAWTRVWRQPAEPADSAPAAAPPEPGWAEALDRWWQLMNPATPPGSREIFGRLIEQGKLFLRFGEGLSSAFAEGGSGFQSTEEWRRAWRAIAESWQSGFTTPPGGEGVGAFWTLPFDTWSRTASSASVFPGDFLGSHKPEAWGHLAEGLQHDLERFLSVPGLGYTREVQEQGQELTRLALEYQRALQAYAATFRTLGIDTLERLERRLAELATRGEPVTTLRALYDVWVDSSEEAYFALVATDAYAEAYGRMVNKLMALKKHGRNMVDEVVGAMGLPTGHGLNTLHQRQQELRREVVALRRELENLRPRAGKPAPNRRRPKAQRSKAQRSKAQRSKAQRSKAQRRHSEEA